MTNFLSGDLLSKGVYVAMIEGLVSVLSLCGYVADINDDHCL
jgi:hypothetical protein